MASKIPVQLKAAAELELRRRQRERAANCYLCEVEALLHQVYGTVAEPGECPHMREQQDIDSVSNQKLIEDIDLMYGDRRLNFEVNNAEIFV